MPACDFPRFVVAAVLIASLSYGADAQVVTDECVAVNVSGKPPESFRPPWSERHPDVVYDQMVARMARNEWFLLADSLYQDFYNDTQSFPSNGRIVLLAQLDTLRREFERVSTRPDFNDLRARAVGVKLDRFKERALGDRVFLFSQSGAEVVVDATWSEAQRRAFCGRTIAIRRLLTAYGQPAREEAVKGLAASAARWDNYADHGYFQYPWELLINGFGFDPKSDDPPGTQWVVAHPAVGLEFVSDRVKSVKDFQPLETLTLEFGWLTYSKSRSWYTGVTAFAAVPSDEVSGVGAMLHAGQQLKLGYVWRKKSVAGQNRNGWLITTDLAQILAKTPARLQQLRDLVGGRLASRRADILKVVRVSGP